MIALPLVLQAFNQMFAGYERTVDERVENVSAGMERIEVEAVNPAGAPAEWVPGVFIRNVGTIDVALDTLYLVDLQNKRIYAILDMEVLRSDVAGVDHPVVKAIALNPDPATGASDPLPPKGEPIVLRPGDELLIAFNLTLDEAANFAVMMRSERGVLHPIALGGDSAAKLVPDTTTGYTGIETTSAGNDASRGGIVVGGDELVLGLTGGGLDDLLTIISVLGIEVDGEAAVPAFLSHQTLEELVAGFLPEGVSYSGVVGVISVSDPTYGATGLEIPPLAVAYIDVTSLRKEAIGGFVESLVSNLKTVEGSPAFPGTYGKWFKYLLKDLIYDDDDYTTVYLVFTGYMPVRDVHGGLTTDGVAFLFSNMMVLKVQYEFDDGVKKVDDVEVEFSLADAWKFKGHHGKLTLGLFYRNSDVDTAISIKDADGDGEFEAVLSTAGAGPGGLLDAGYAMVYFAVLEPVKPIGDTITVEVYGKTVVEGPGFASSVENLLNQTMLAMLVFEVNSTGHGHHGKGKTLISLAGFDYVTYNDIDEDVMTFRVTGLSSDSHYVIVFVLVDMMPQESLTLIIDQIVIYALN